MAAHLALAVLLAALSGTPETAESQRLPTAAEVDEALERVLSLPEFRPPEKNWLRQALDWIQEKLDEVKAWFFRGLGKAIGNEIVGIAVLAALAAALIYLLARIAWTVLSQRRLPAAARKGAAPEVLPALHPDPHLARAAELAAAGEFLEAARSLYLGTILFLDSAGRARYAESKTGGEYARELRGSPQEAQFRALLRSFEPVVFGGRPASREAYEAMRSSAGALGVLP